MVAWCSIAWPIPTSSVRRGRSRRASATWLLRVGVRVRDRVRLRLRGRVRDRVRLRLRGRVRDRVRLRDRDRVRGAGCGVQGATDSSMVACTGCAPG